MGTSDLQPSQTDIMSNLRAYSLQAGIGNKG